MADLICGALGKDKPPVPSEQLLIENIVAKVEEIRTKYIKGEFSNLLKDKSEVIDGLLSDFFGDSFAVSAELDPQYIPEFTHLLGNMPKSLLTDKNSNSRDF